MGRFNAIRKMEAVSLAALVKMAGRYASRFLTTPTRPLLIVYVVESRKEAIACSHSPFRQDVIQPLAETFRELNECTPC